MDTGAAAAAGERGREGKRPEYIIEHMEDDVEGPAAAFPEWALLEHMLTHVGSTSTVHFTALSNASIASLGRALMPSAPSDLEASSAARPLGSAHSSSTLVVPATPTTASAHLHNVGVLDFLAARGVSIDRVCLLDPKSEVEIGVADSCLSAPTTEPAPTPGEEQGGARFEYFLFGGILGDDPPRDRTGALRDMGFPTRHLGPIQMTTDTALGVTKCVAEDHIPLSSVGYVDYPELRFGKRESVSMPFRYIALPIAETSDGADTRPRPLLPPGMRELIRKDLDKSFEF